MRLGKLAATLMVFAGALLAPATATAEQAEVAASCVPAEQDQWLGTYRGPHYFDSGEEYGVFDIRVFVENGKLLVEQFNDYQVEGRFDENGLLNGAMGWLVAIYVTDATCGSDGTVTAMAGNWWRNFDLWCPSCVSSGQFEVVRI